MTRVPFTFPWPTACTPARQPAAGALPAASTRGGVPQFRRDAAPTPQRAGARLPAAPWPATPASSRSAAPRRRRGRPSPARLPAPGPASGRGQPAPVGGARRGGRGMAASLFPRRALRLHHRPGRVAGQSARHRRSAPGRVSMPRRFASGRKGQAQESRLFPGGHGATMAELRGQAEASGDPVAAGILKAHLAILSTPLRRQDRLGASPRGGCRRRGHRKPRRVRRRHARSPSVYLRERARDIDDIAAAAGRNTGTGSARRRPRSPQAMHRSGRRPFPPPSPFPGPPSSGAVLVSSKSAHTSPSSWPAPLGNPCRRPCPSRRGRHRRPGELVVATPARAGSGAARPGR